MTRCGTGRRNLDEKLKKNNKFSWELTPDPEAYQIFTRNYEKHGEGTENTKSGFFFSRIPPSRPRAGRSEQRGAPWIGNVMRWVGSNNL